MRREPVEIEKQGHRGGYQQCRDQEGLGDQGAADRVLPPFRQPGINGYPADQGEEPGDAADFQEKDNHLILIHDLSLPLSSESCMRRAK